MAVCGSSESATRTNDSFHNGSSHHQKPVVARRRRSSGSSSVGGSVGSFDQPKKNMKRRSPRCISAAGGIPSRWLVDYRRKQAQLSANSLLRLQSLVDSTRKARPPPDNIDSYYYDTEEEEQDDNNRDSGEEGGDDGSDQEDQELRQQGSSGASISSSLSSLSTAGDPLPQRLSASRSLSPKPPSSRPLSPKPPTSRSLSPKPAPKKNSIKVPSDDPLEGDSEHSIGIHQVFTASAHTNDTGTTQDNSQSRYQRFSISVTISDYNEKIQFLLRNPEVVKAVRKALQQPTEEASESISHAHNNNTSNSSRSRRQIKCIIPHDRFQLPQMQAVRPEQRLSSGSASATGSALGYHHSGTNLAAKLHCIAEDYEVSHSEVFTPDEDSTTVTGDNNDNHSHHRQAKRRSTGQSWSSSCSSFAQDSFGGGSNNSSVEEDLDNSNNKNDNNHHHHSNAELDDDDRSETSTIASILSTTLLEGDDDEDDAEEEDIFLRVVVKRKEEKVQDVLNAIAATDDEDTVPSQRSDAQVATSTDEDSSSSSSSSESETEEVETDADSARASSSIASSTIQGSVASSTANGSLADRSTAYSVSESTIADSVAAVVTSLLDDGADDEEEEEELTETEFTYEGSNAALVADDDDDDDVTEFAHEDDDVSEFAEEDDTEAAYDEEAASFREVVAEFDESEAALDETETGEAEEPIEYASEVGEENTSKLTNGQPRRQLSEIREDADGPTDITERSTHESDAGSTRDGAEEPQTDGEDSCLTNNTDNSSQHNLTYGLSVYLSNHSPRRECSSRGLVKKADCGDSKTCMTASETSVSRSTNGCMDESAQTSNTNKTGSSKGTNATLRTYSSHRTAGTNRTSNSAPGALLTTSDRNHSCRSLSSTRSQLDESIHSRSSFSMDDLSRASSAPVEESRGSRRRRRPSLMLAESSRDTDVSGSSLITESEADDSTVGSSVDHRRRRPPRLSRSRSSDDLQPSTQTRSRRGSTRGPPMIRDKSGLIPRSNTPQGTLLRTRSGDLSGRPKGSSDARPRMPPRLASRDSSMGGGLAGSSRLTRSRSMMGASSSGMDRSRGLTRSRSGHRDSFMGGSKIKKWDSSSANKSGHGLSLLERHLHEGTAKAKKKSRGGRRTSVASRSHLQPSVASLSVPSLLAS
ncbi:expressed unknown protein [Seminavis robusta]|uniref:Uncharacterized protein n=1 Tax=Seminavis robusta TaxID=568900 RepID=A0A9N8EMI5_9STRA|nr:expressed unknown protein [Seminavis robusta]|eukprot:Sro1367_g266740.1 n/a (1153) ;mRNA; f:21424-24882